MTEISHGTPENPNIDTPKTPDNIGALSADEIAMIEELRAKQTAAEHPISNIKLDAEQRAAYEARGPFWTRRRKIGGAVVAGVAVLVTAGIGVARAFGGNSTSAAPQPVPSATAPVSPTPQPSSAETTVTTSPTPEVVAPLESDQDTADKLIARDNTEFFEETGSKDRELAVDGVYAKIMLGGPEADPFTKITFDEKRGEAIISKNPVQAAAERADNNREKIERGEEPTEHPTPQDILNAIGAQGILDQLRFQYNNVFSQIAGPDDRKGLDQSKGVNMLAGLYDDPLSPEAQHLKKLIENQETVDNYGAENRWFLQSTVTGDEKPSASERVLTHDFGDGKQKEYIVINYMDVDDTPRYYVLTPVESKFNGVSPYDLETVLEMEITKWKIVKEGKGRENTEGKLGQ